MLVPQMTFIPHHMIYKLAHYSKAFIKLTPFYMTRPAGGVVQVYPLFSG